MILFQFLSHVEIGRMQKRAKMMKAEVVKPLRHNVNCSAAIFGRPQLGHSKAQGRAIFSRFVDFFLFSRSFIFCFIGVTKIVVFFSKSTSNE